MDFFFKGCYLFVFMFDFRLKNGFVFCERCESCVDFLKFYTCLFCVYQDRFHALGEEDFTVLLV